MPGFTFPAVGRLGLTSSPSRRLYEPEAHLIGQPWGTDHRYYDQLRLPDACLGFVRFSLSSPDTLFAPLLSLAGQVRAPLHSAWISPHWLTGTRQPDYCNTRKTSGSPLRGVGSTRHRLYEPEAEFPNYPRECMPWSQTPVVSCQLAIA